MQERDASFKLQPSTVTESVEVSASTMTVETDEANIATVTDEQLVQELPIQGRNVFGVANQTPGVTGTGLMGGNNDIFEATTTPALVANGAPNHSNTYLLDGVSLDDSPAGGDSKLSPNPDSVQEVVVSTTNYSAQFGKGASLVTQITSKSGTNAFHGSGFENFQNNTLTARTEFQNYKDPVNGYITPFTHNEFGGSIGGPIRKDKTFFFASYEAVRSNTTSSGQVQVEDPAFVSWMTANQPKALETTLLNTYKPTVNPTPSAVQTVGAVYKNQTGNACPANGVAIGAAIMDCNMAMIDSTSGVTNSLHNGYQYNGRVDQTFANSRDRIYGNMYNTHLVGPWNAGVRKQFQLTFPQDAWYGAFNYTHVFSPSIVNEAGIGFTRTSVDIPCADCNLLPTNINGIVGFGDGFAPVGFAQNDLHWRDMVSIVHGKHALKTGFEMFHNQDFAPFTIPDNRGQSWNFDTIFDFAANNVGELNGISFDPKTGGVANNNRYFVDSTYGAYIQDDWKVRRDLTVNLGLRWDAISNPQELKDNLSTLIVPTSGTLLQQAAGMGVGLNADPSKRRPFIDHKKTYFAPRFGFAWQPFGMREWSVRGGAGVFFDRGGNTNWSDTETGNPPIDANFSASIHNPNSPQPPAFALCASAVFPYNCPLPVGLTTTLPALNPRGGYGNSDNIGGPDPHLKMAYAENYFFGIQRAFRSNWLVEADYTHSNSIHEYVKLQLNNPAGINQITKDAQGNFHETLSGQPNPYFNAIQWTSNQAGSGYNGFTSFVRRSFAHGYTFQVSYTIQKTLDIASAAPGGQKGAENASVIYEYNTKFQRGISSQDVPKQFSFNGMWKIPNPNIGNGVVKSLVGGWEISTMGSLMGGLPATVFTSAQQYDFNKDGIDYDLPNVPLFGRTLKGLSRSQYMKGTFTADQFPLPVDANGIPTGVEGNLGRNTYRGPGFAETDLSLVKNTILPWFSGDKSDLQVRLDMYNALNRVNMQGWDTNLNDGNFGKAGGTAQARTLQLSAHFSF
jgi:hypothetical protein